MKTNLLIAIFILITNLSYSQMDIVATSGNDGIALKLNNTNSYYWQIRSEATSSWGHTNTLDFANKDGHLTMQVYPDKRVNINGKLNVDYWISLHQEDKGTLGEANGYDFNPNRSDEGMILEQYSAGESSGFYSDGDYAAIWSPGDYGYLLKVIDEDGMDLKWYVNGSGYDFHNSDERKKENIKDFEGAIDKIKKIKGVSYNFILNNEEKQKYDSISYLDISEADKQILKEKMKKDQIGFLAQNLEKTFPEVVETDNNGNKYVNYDGIIPVLVEGIKEQQALIEEMQKEIEKLKKEKN